MPESTDLKAEMAACWKLVWNVDPLPFSVPERLELVLGLLLPVLGVVVLELELQALTMSMPRTAVVTAAQRALLLLIVVTVSLLLNDRVLPLNDRALPDGRPCWRGGVLRDWQASRLPLPPEPAA